MIIVRVAKGIADHLPARASEWALATILFNWGLVLSDSSELFVNSRSFAELARWADESTWAALCLLVGGLRLIALFVNGTFLGFRYSPHVRTLMSFLTCFFWLSITFGVLQADHVSTGLAVYPVLLALDIYNAYRAAKDARLVDEAKKHGIP